jgi:hypothetical protein
MIFFIPAIANSGKLKPFHVIPGTKIGKHFTYYVLNYRLIDMGLNSTSGQHDYVWQSWLSTDEDNVAIRVVETVTSHFTGNSNFDVSILANHYTGSISGITGPQYYTVPADLIQLWDSTHTYYYDNMTIETSAGNMYYGEYDSLPVLYNPSVDYV